ncbi:Calcium and integrin-binding protein 1 [Nymphon striatum]|nr:Calcium and integrin-binding protein 1 [Nymphon striatum]
MALIPSRSDEIEKLTLPGDLDPVTFGLGLDPYVRSRDLRITHANNAIFILQELTFFTQKEILHIFKKFRLLSPKEIDVDPHVRIPWSRVVALPELQKNPFGDRLCHVFSSQRDGHMSFDDFLDMMHVLSDYVSVRTKAAYAFAVYDFDDDGVISPDDLIILVNRLIGDENKFDAAQMSSLVDTIMDEVGIDEDGVLGADRVRKSCFKIAKFSQVMHLDR